MKPKNSNPKKVNDEYTQIVIQFDELYALIEGEITEEYPLLGERLKRNIWTLKNRYPKRGFFLLQQYLELNFRFNYNLKLYFL